MRRPVLSLLPLFFPRARLLVACQLGLLVATGLNLAGPYLLSVAIDRDIGGNDIQGLKGTAALYLVVVLANLLVTYSGRVGMESAAQSAMFLLKKRLFAHLLRHDFAFHDKQTSGRLITRVQGDTDALRVLFTEVVLSLPADLALLVGMFGVLSWKAPAAGLLIATVLPVYIVLFLIFRRYAPPLFLETRRLKAEVTGFYTEHLKAMPTFQLFGRTSWARREAQRLNASLYNIQSRADVAPVFYFNAVFLVRSLAFAAVLFFGGLKVAEGVLSVGALVMGLGYLRLIFNPLMRLSVHLSTVERARAAALRIRDILDEEPKIQDPERPAAWPGLQKGIRLSGVRFAYTEDTPVLRGIDLEIPAGCSVGIVGATGCGKSTLVNLLLRFREISEGSISIDGVDIRELAQADLRTAMALVPQDVLLLPGTLLENLGGDRNKAQAALDALGLGFDLDREVDLQGSGLSRGERQLLTFARALVEDPDLLLLDEATSSVDPATEARIQQALKHLQADRTTIMVAHRLATVVHCDFICVLAHGRLVEKGTHRELLAKGGIYQALYELQQGRAA